MSTSGAQQRSEYLARLDVAMREVPHGVATEIRAGIAEELDGLDAAATAARIEQLGDPAAIAFEARSESEAASASVIAPQPQDVGSAKKAPLAESRGFAIAAALVFALGGFAVPLLGWLVGVVMVLMSGLWRRWEKAVAILLPFAAAVLTAVVIWLMRLASAPDEHNPLIPSGLDLWHSGVLFVFLVIPVAGGWLLWRLRGR